MVVGVLMLDHCATSVCYIKAGYVISQSARECPIDLPASVNEGANNISAEVVHRPSLACACENLLAADLQRTDSAFENLIANPHLTDQQILPSECMGLTRRCAKKSSLWYTNVSTSTFEIRKMYIRPCQCVYCTLQV